MGRTGLDHKRSFSYAHVSIFIRQGYTKGKRENGPAQTRRQSRETVREGGEVRWLESRKRESDSFSAHVCCRIYIL